MLAVHARKSLFTQFDVKVACLVHAVGSGQDDVLSENGSSTEPTVFLIQEESLWGPNKKDKISCSAEDYTGIKTETVKSNIVLR